MKYICKQNKIKNKMKTKTKAQAEQMLEVMQTIHKLEIQSISNRIDEMKQSMNQTKSNIQSMKNDLDQYKSALMDAFELFNVHLKLVEQTDVDEHDVDMLTSNIHQWIQSNKNKLITE